MTSLCCVSVENDVLRIEDCGVVAAVLAVLRTRADDDIALIGAGSTGAAAAVLSTPHAANDGGEPSDDQLQAVAGGANQGLNELWSAFARLPQGSLDCRAFVVGAPSTRSPPATQEQEEAPRQSGASVSKEHYYAVDCPPQLRRTSCHKHTSSSSMQSQ